MPKESYESILCALAPFDAVRFSFDDGNASDLDIGLPCLQREKRNAIFFVSTAYIGSRGYLDGSGIALLYREGMIIGSHGHAHRPLANLCPDEIHRDLARSKEILENLVGDRVVDLAIPFGRYDWRITHEARKCGYETIYTSDGGIAPLHRRLVPRRSAMLEDSPEALLAYCQGLAKHPYVYSFSSSLKSSLKKILG